MALSRANGNGLALEWSVESWKLKRALQLPEYPDENELGAVLKVLESYPPLVLPREIMALEERLAEVAMGKAFLLQGGDCAESFKEFSEDKIRDAFATLAQMSTALAYGGQMPVIKVGRIAGQFAKPRSTTHEEKDGVKLPIYKGDCINGYSFDKKSRTPDPQRLIRAHSQSAMTLNLLRALVNGGYAAPRKFTESNLKFLENTGHHDRYEELARSMNEAMGFMAANGVFTDTSRVAGKTNEFWTSHECLLLPYEQVLTKKDSYSGLYFDYSAHMLWIGERTRQLDGAHVEFLRGVANPIGIKVSDKMEGKELVDLIDILNPHKKPGRITVITRMGAENLRAKLPHLIRAVSEAGQTVSWICDPVHGNAIKAPCGRRTRAFDAIVAEVEAFFDVHEKEGSHAGGIHLEMTGQDVTECVGGSPPVSYADLGSRYLSNCDPRLNASQSLELAYMVALRLKEQRTRGFKTGPSSQTQFYSK